MIGYKQTSCKIGAHLLTKAIYELLHYSKGDRLIRGYNLWKTDKLKIDKMCKKEINRWCLKYKLN